MRDLKPATPLRVARVRAGWKQKALAVKVGLHVTTLWRLEDGRTTPTLATRKALAKALKVSEAALFDGVGK